MPDPDTGELDHSISLIRNDGDDELFGGFVTPFTTNRVQGNRLTISANVFFESFDRGDHIAELRDASGFGAFAGAHGMAYGHPGNPDIFYAAEFSQLAVRETLGTPRRVPLISTGDDDLLFFGRRRHGRRVSNGLHRGEHVRRPQTRSQPCS